MATTPTRATKTTPAARKAATPVPPTTAPAAPAAPKNGRLDLTALAAGAKKVAVLPKAQRNGGGSTGGAFAPLIKRSWDEKTALALPAVPNEDAVKTLRNALRRAAAAQNLGVSVRPEQTDEGIVVHFQAKAKNGNGK
jgi:hypothetical protein